MEGDNSMRLSGIYKAVIEELRNNEPKESSEYKAGYLMAEIIVAGKLADEIKRRIDDEEEVD